MARARKPDAVSGMGAPGRFRTLGTRARVVVPRPWLTAFTILLVIPWLVAAAIYVTASAEDRREPMSPGVPTESPVGPWGHLVRTPIVISPPAEYVPDNWGPPMPLLWHVPVSTAAELTSFLSSAGVASGDIASLHATVRPESQGGVVLQPDVELVRRLSPEVRARLYLQMARSQVNRDEYTAFRFHGVSPEAWLGSRVSKETIDMIAPFVFRQGDFMYLADIDAVWPRVEDPAELRRLAKALNRQATLLVTLHVENPEEVPALVEYWGRGGRRMDIRPLLESLAEGEHRSLDISHLLPPLARQLLYRYPRLTVADHERPVLPNCLWTALNFFNHTPEDRYFDVQIALETLEREYSLVHAGPQLGDIVAFSDSDGNLFHVAVYVADDLVFGKNGISPMSPWSILPIERIKGHYLEYSEGWRVTFHRRNA
jgi:hypothetical protein